MYVYDSDCNLKIFDIQLVVNSISRLKKKILQRHYLMEILTDEKYKSVGALNLCVCEQQWVLNIYGADTFCSLIRDYHQVSSGDGVRKGI